VASPSSPITDLAKVKQSSYTTKSLSSFLGMQWSDKFRLVDLLKRFLGKNLMITLQRVHGHHRLVHGHLRNQRPLHRVKNLNNVLREHQRNGLKEKRFHVHRSGVDIV
jgi:hypothetical protein